MLFKFHLEHNRQAKQQPADIRPFNCWWTPLVVLQKVMCFLHHTSQKYTRLHFRVLHCFMLSEWFDTSEAGIITFTRTIKSTHTDHVITTCPQSCSFVLKLRWFTYKSLYKSLLIKEFFSFWFKTQGDFHTVGCREQPNAGIWRPEWEHDEDTGAKIKQRQYLSNFKVMWFFLQMMVLHTHLKWPHKPVFSPHKETHVAALRLHTDRHTNSCPLSAVA